MTILLVEDDPVSQQIASQLLVKWGVEVTVAQDGLEALQAIRESSFDLVLMDINMPLMDGFEATSLIRSADDAYLKTVPILAYTASSLVDSREKAQQFGMNDFVRKPLSAPELHCKINQYVLPLQTERRNLNITFDLYADSDPEFKAELVSLMISNLRELQYASYKSYYSGEARSFNIIYHKVKSTITLLDDMEFTDCLSGLMDGFEGGEKSAVLQQHINRFNRLSEGIIKSLNSELSMFSAKA